MGVGCGSVCRNAGCGRDPARAWGALGLRKGGGSCGEFSRGIGSSGLCGTCEGQLLRCGGRLGPAPKVQLPPWSEPTSTSRVI